MSMSPFWKYFHDSLHWPQIFRPGPLSALLKGLALYMDGVRGDILWLREQWTPAKCEDGLVGRHGASRGIARQRFDTDESFRKRVVNAYAWHRMGGKVRGLEQIFAENGLEGMEVLPASLAELWAHFRLGIDVTGREWTPDSAALSWWLTNEYKPARSVLECLMTSIRVPMEIRCGVGLRSRTASAGLGLRFREPAPVPLREWKGAAVSGATHGTMRLRFAEPAPMPVRPFRALRLAGVTSSGVALHFPPPLPAGQRRRLAAGSAALTASRMSLARSARGAA